LGYLLWLVAGVALAAIGWAAGLNVGNDLAGVVVAAAIIGGVAAAELWANRSN
jgi:hypothetical protein